MASASPRMRTLCCKLLCAQDVAGVPLEFDWQTVCIKDCEFAAAGVLRRLARKFAARNQRRMDTLKKIMFAVLILMASCVFGIPSSVAQETASQTGTAAAGGGANAFTDQQFALLRKDIRSIKKQLIAPNLILTESEATKFWL